MFIGLLRKGRMENEKMDLDKENKEGRETRQKIVSIERW